MKTVPVQVIRVDETLDLPKYASEAAVGFDLQASFHSHEGEKYIAAKVKTNEGTYIVPEGTEELTLRPFERAMIPAGIIVGLPLKELQIRSRSGEAWNNGLIVINQPGTVDPDFHNTVRILVINLGFDDVVIHQGDRIAQGVIADCMQAEWTEVQDTSQFGTNDRGGGFGHTGRN